MNFATWAQPCRFLLDCIAPQSCLGCGQRVPGPDTPYCVSCAGRLPWWRRADGCPRCGWALASPSAEQRLAGRACPGCYSQGSALHRAWAALRYEGDAQQAIQRFKAGKRPLGPALSARLAVEFFTHELARHCPFDPRHDLIVPIPLHPRRQRARGFNQSALIALGLGRVSGVRVQTDVLIRLRATETQAHQRGDARRANLRGAFRLAKKASEPARRVWLVDDVLTTGATLETAAECLLAAGANEVHALTLASTRPAR